MLLQKHCGGGIRLNSGMMVLEPSLEIYDKLVNAILPTKLSISDRPIGDQDVFKYIYSDWPQREELHLPGTYNCYHSDVDELARRGYWKYEDVYILHFTLTKPWNVQTMVCYKQIVLCLLGKSKNCYYLAIANLEWKKHYWRALRVLKSRFRSGKESL